LKVLDCIEVQGRTLFPWLVIGADLEYLIPADRTPVGDELLSLLYPGLEHCVIGAVAHDGPEAGRMSSGQIVGRLAELVPGKDSIQYCSQAQGELLICHVKQQMVAGRSLSTGQTEKAKLGLEAVLGEDWDPEAAAQFVGKSGLAGPWQTRDQHEGSIPA
jgi:hypothetical protein